MFATTFLGHQGWVVQTDQACLLFDPLLCEDFGAAHALDYRVFPPRQFDWAQFPKIDALVLSHEHDDHFDIPSLMKIDRRIPVLLSSRASTAGYRFLTELGFQVEPLVPGIILRIGDLELLPLVADHVNSVCGDEWDTLPFMVRHTEGDGSFFTMVDIPLTQGHLHLARSFVPKPGIVGWTNNAMDWSHMAAYVMERTEGTEQAIVRMHGGHGLLTSQWGQPAALVMCAGGMAFSGERAWLNRHVFCVDPEKVIKTMSNHFPNQRFYSGRPGQTWFMERGQLKKMEKQSPWLSILPPSTWPLRTKSGSKDIPDYAPATGRRQITDREVDRLRTRLNQFAGDLVAGTLFKSLYSTIGIEADGLACTFAFVLRSGDDRKALVFEYNPPSCSFEQAQGTAAQQPERAYVAGIECWATDLLAVLDGDLGPIAIVYGRARLWNNADDRFNFDIFNELYRVSHPLRRPNEYLRTYQRLRATAPPSEICVLPR